MTQTNTYKKIKLLSRVLSACLLLGLFSFSSHAQLVVNAYNTAASLAATLTGPGVIVLNPTLNCAGAANGIFTVGAVSPINMPSGIVLTTGSVIDTTDFFGDPTSGVANPESAGGFGFASADWELPGDPQLDALSGNPTGDACVLEFDIVPAGDTIKFNYVFGSEEYDGFTCSEFNDVFAFFITGGAFTTATNLALVPGTNIPVCINSVNCGATGGWPTSTCSSLGSGSPFCAYYVNNELTSVVSNPYVVYNGLTTLLQAVTAVAPCDTYHLKLAIADGGDDAYDSGVFIEGGSLSSTGISVAPLGINPSDTGFGAQYCIRECTPGEFIFHATGSLADTTVIHFSVGGTAVDGYDYSTILDSVIIPAHDSVDTLFIYGLPVTPAGPKTVELYVYGPYTCSGAPIVIDSAELTIYDSLYVQILTPDTTICQGQSIQINATGATQLVYNWSPGGTLDNNTVLSPVATPTVTTTYSVAAVYPGSGCLPSYAQVTVSIATPPAINVGPPIQTVCRGNPLQLNVSVSPASSAYTYSWAPAMFLNSDTITNPIASTTDMTGNTEFVVTVIPGGITACAVSDSFQLQLVAGANMAIYPGNTTISYGDHIRLNAVDLDPGSLIYYWMPNDGSLTDANINDPIASPLTTTTYTVIGMSPLGCIDTLSETITVDQDMTECLPTAFTPNNDGLNDVFRLCNIHYQKLIEFSVFNRWGQKVYDNTTDPTKGWDGKFNGEPQDIGVYNYVIIVSHTDGSTKTYTGSVTLIR